MSITTTAGIPSYIATATVPDLTTFFTPPASCVDRYVAGANNNNLAWSTYSRDGFQQPVDSIYYSCLPRNLRGPHFSPGVCTDGQTIAGMTKYEASGSRTMWQAQCCKSGMTISVQTIQSSPVSMCVSAFSTPFPVQALLTTTFDNGIVTSMYNYVANDQSTKSNMTTMTRGTAIADPLYVAWEAKDLSLFPVAYATSLASKIGVDFTPTATPASSASGGPTQTGAAPPADEGLSTGAKIGIGVGAGAGGVVLAAVGVLFLILRRKRKAAPPTEVHEDYAAPAYKDNDMYRQPAIAEVENHEVQRVDKEQWGYAHGNGSHGVVMNELDSRPVHGPMAPVELDGSSAPAGQK